MYFIFIECISIILPKENSLNGLWAIAIVFIFIFVASGIFLFFGYLKFCEKNIKKIKSEYTFFRKLKASSTFLIHDRHTLQEIKFIKKLSLILNLKTNKLLEKKLKNRQGMQNSYRSKPSAMLTGIDNSAFVRGKFSRRDKMNSKCYKNQVKNSSFVNEIITRGNGYRSFRKNTEAL